MTNLVGLYDQEASAFSSPGTWILDTIALSENPAPKNYNHNFSWIVRANWGYGSTGTIPLDTAAQRVFIQRLVGLVRNSSNCTRWIIGNEPNLPAEWPNGKPIYPDQYAAFYLACRDAVHRESSEHEVLIAAAGPWNDQLKYQGNSMGDWLKNFSDVISACDGKIDGFSIHSYTHGYSSSLVTAQTLMNPPFENHHYDFQTYRDYLNVITDSLGHLPVYLTEANGGPDWQAVGLMPAMAAEINGYNQTATDKKIKCLIFYRWPHYDNYYIQGKSSVEQEYKNTVALNYQSPAEKTKPPQTPTPIAENIYTGKPVATVTAALLNVRDMPGLGGKIIGTKKSGDKISILDQKQTDGTWWYQIGPDQWISADWTDRPVTVTLSDWERAKRFTARWEGGFQDADWDAGNWTGCEVGKGEKKGTNFGISACSHPNLDIKNLTRDQADTIYYQEYWLPSGADKLPYPLNLIHFDTAIQFGVSVAKSYLDRSKGDILRYIGLRLNGYRHSDAWPQAHNAWTDRMVDLILTATN